MNEEIKDELLVLAWGVIANADWDAHDTMWREAAERWREKWFAHISKNAKPELPVDFERSSLDWKAVEDDAMVEAYEAPVERSLINRVEVCRDNNGHWSAYFFQANCAVDESGHPTIKGDENFLVLFEKLANLEDLVALVDVTIEDLDNNQRDYQAIRDAGQQPVTTTEHSPSEQGQDADSPVQLICDHQKFTICLCGWYDCFNKRDFIYCPKCGEKL